MTRRAALDELRREGQARVKRLHEIAKEDSGWRLRDSDDPGTICLLAMVGWRLEHARIHQAHASQEADP